MKHVALLDKAIELFAQLTEIDRQFTEAIEQEDQEAGAARVEQLLDQWLRLSQDAEPGATLPSPEALLSLTFPIQQLHLAIERDNLLAARKLLELGVSPYVADAHLKSPLRTIAIATDPIKWAQLLEAMGFDLEGVDSLGLGLVHYAASVRDETRDAEVGVAFLKWLAAQGVDIDAPVMRQPPTEPWREDGLISAASSTAAGLAYQQGHKLLLMALFDLGASDRLLDDKGMDLLQHPFNESAEKTGLLNLVQSIRARNRALQAVGELAKRSSDEVHLHAANH